MMSKRTVFFLLGALFLPATGAAQTQTAAGAQQFIATLLTSGKAAGSVFAPGVQVMEHPYGGGASPVTIDMTAKGVAMTADPRSACGSIVQGITLNPSDYNLTNGGVAEINHKTYSFDSLPAPPNQYQINWGKVRVERGGFSSGMTMGGRVTVDQIADMISVVSGDGMRLQFYTGDPDLLDRVEYALKFLVKSCDTTADTGF